MVNLTSSIGNQISRIAFSKTINQPYSVFLYRNSSEVLSVLTKQLHLTISSLNRLAIFITACAICSSIFIGLLITSFTISLIAISFFALYYLIIFYFSKNKLLINSKIIKSSSANHYKKIQESLGNIRDIKVYGIHETQVDEFSKIDKGLRKAEASNVFLVGFPRFTIEAAGLFLLIIFGLILLINGFSKSYLIGVIGTLALASQRLLPSLQQIYTSFSVIKGNSFPIQEVINYLDQEIEIKSYSGIKEALSFEKNIVLKDIVFFHKKSNNIFDKLSLTINKSDHIGLVGNTGSGKSTLLDIIMMLLVPKSGEFLIDGENIINNPENHKRWRRNISYIPQSIFLNDSTIEENITLQKNKENMDYQLLDEVIQIAQLKVFINTLPKGLQTYVGEAGIRLSGGQRQRIGIARALYRQSKLLILDEATSALDKNTENAFLKALHSYRKGLTTISVAHKLETLKTCSNWFILKNGVVRKISSYDQLITDS
tara:strand:- start:47217 stop:48674 length:1458 start_codon:yes stop_codon:yes gene_type:complete